MTLTSKRPYVVERGDPGGFDALGRFLCSSGDDPPRRKAGPLAESWPALITLGLPAPWRWPAPRLGLASPTLSRRSFGSPMRGGRNAEGVLARRSRSS